MARIRPSAGGDQVFVSLASHELPEVEMIGVHRVRQASPGLHTHSHRGVMEIRYLVKGERVLRVAGRDYRIKGNDLFWTREDEVHGSGPHPHGKGLQYWLKVRLPRMPRRFLAMSARDAWPLVRSLRSMPLRQFPGRASIKELFDDVFRLAHQRPTPLRRLSFAAKRVEWLCLVVECSHHRGTPAYSEQIRNALDRIESSPQPQGPICQLAAAVHLSESRFKAKFRTEVGMPPAEYMLRRRVQLAWELLENPQNTVTSVSRRLGFSSSQYFATVFRRFTNTRPSDVRHRRSARRPVFRRGPRD